MNKKQEILTVLAKYPAMHFADLFDQLLSFEKKQNASALLSAMKTDGLVEQDPATRHYAITELGERYLAAPSRRKDRRTADDPPPMSSGAPHLPPEIIAELKKLHGQFGRVIKALEGRRTVS